MLYSLYEWQSSALAPLRLMGEVTRGVLTNPLHPVSYTHMGRSIVAGLDVFESVTRHRPKPAWGVDSIATAKGQVAIEERLVCETAFCQLHRFRRSDRIGKDPTVLLVAPLSGHHATLLRGTLRTLLEDHEVYVTDWVDAAQIPAEAGEFGLDQYLGHLLRFIRMLGPEVHVIAVCQPAPLVLAAVALLAADGDPRQPRTMTLMGGPVDVDAAPTVPTRFAKSKPLSWFRRHLVTEVPAYYPGRGREVYPGFLQLGSFISMNPHRHFDAHIKMFEHLIEGDGDSVEAHHRFYNEYLAVMDVPASYYLETVDAVFQRRLLPLGQLRWLGELADCTAIEKTALLTVEGELDDISAPGQTMAAHDLCSSLPESKQANHLQKGVGHYGIFNGRRWREQIKPVIGDFIRQHAG